MIHVADTRSESLMVAIVSTLPLFAQYVLLVNMQISFENCMQLTFVMQLLAKK